MSAPGLGFFVKLLVLDQRVSAAFYEGLGFTRVGADGTFVHVRWEERGDVMLMGAPRGVRVDGKRGWGVLRTACKDLTPHPSSDPFFHFSPLYPFVLEHRSV